MGNQRGSFLLEHVISMTILSVITLIICTTVVGGRNLYLNSLEERIRINEVYDSLESGISSEDSLYQTTKEGTITFKHDTYEVEISGVYYYDKEKEKLGEFIME